MEGDSSLLLDVDTGMPRNIMYVHVLKTPQPDFLAALRSMGANAEERDCSTNSSVTNMDECVHTIIQDINDKFGSTSNVTLVSHSWAGVPATYAAVDLGSRFERIVYYGSVIPNVTVGQGYDEFLNTAMRHKWEEWPTVGSYQYEHLTLGYKDWLYYVWDGSDLATYWMYSHPHTPRPDVDMGTFFSGKTTILLGIQDYSAGLTEHGVNSFLSHPTRLGIFTTRIIRPPGDHFYLTDHPTLFASYVYYSIRAPPRYPPPEWPPSFGN